jgi:hypothetical protein
MTSFVGGLPVAACLKPRLGLPTDVSARHRPRAPGRSVVQRERLQSELGHPAHPGRRSPLQTRRQAQRTGTSAELERSGGRISSTASSQAAAGRTGVRSQGWSKTAFVHLDPNPAESVRPTVGRRCERIPGIRLRASPGLMYGSSIRGRMWSTSPSDTWGRDCAGSECLRGWSCPWEVVSSPTPAWRHRSRGCTRISHWRQPA